MLTGKLDGFDSELAHKLGLVRTGEALEFIMDMGDLDVVLPLDQPSLLGFPMEDDRSQLHQDSTCGLEQGIQGSMSGADVESTSIDANQVFPFRSPVRTLLGEDILDGINQPLVGREGLEVGSVYRPMNLYTEE